MDDPEKIKLKEKLAELEKDLLDNKKLETIDPSEDKNNEDKKNN